MGESFFDQEHNPYSVENLQGTMNALRRLERSVRARHRQFAAIVMIVLAITVAVLFVPPTVRANPRTINVPGDYATIQKAVDASNPGDTIIVAAGTFNESVVVEKSLVLLGQGSGKTIIDARAQGAGINITGASGVRISGFTIRDTDLLDSGVLVASSTNITIENNLVQAFTQSNGTYLVDSNNVVIRDNNITGNQYGINVQGGFGNLIQGNNSTKNNVGVGIFTSMGNKIVDNIFRYEPTGVDVNYGSNGNIIARNIISNDTFGLRVSSSSNNVIRENNIDFNNAQSYSIGVYLSSARTNKIYYNNIRNNTIQMAGSSAGDVVGNIWNDSAASPRGNYWSDYNGTDNDADGVGDTMVPWPCPNGGSPCAYNGPPGVDWYPLMSPWKASPIGVTAVANTQFGCPGSSGLKVNFAASAQGGLSPYVYTWNFDDGISGTGQNVSHNYTGRGPFFPSVTAVDSKMANGTDLVAVIVFSGSLALTVSDTSSRPVPQTNITSVSQPPRQSGFKIETDNNGAATVGCLYPGSYAVQISHLNYKTQIVRFSVSNQTVNVPVVLEPISTPSSGFLPSWAIYVLVGTAAAIILGTVVVYRSRRRGSPPAP